MLLFEKLDFGEDEFDLTRYILTSEVRLELLLNLYGGSKNLSEITFELNKKPGNLLRGLNELIDRKLVVKHDKLYSLSSAGYLLSMNVINLFENLNALNRHFDFWQKHSISSFSYRFIKKFSLWENAELIESNSIEFDRTFKVYFENLSKSRQISMLLPIFPKIYMNIILESLIKNDGTLSIITNKAISDLIYENDEDGVFDSLVKSGRINVFLTEHDLEMFFTSCDNFASLFLFFDKMLFDDSQMLLISDEVNIKDATNMFNHLRQDLMAD